jgi:hypothetical protein
MLELLQEVGCDLKGQARFAAAASASEGEQPARHEQPSDRGHLAFAANKPVHLERQIVRRGVEVLRHCYIFHGMPSSSLGTILHVGYSFFSWRDGQALREHDCELTRWSAFTSLDLLDCDSGAADLLR